MPKGWIKPSFSLYGAPVLFARKKTRELRMYIKLKALNVNIRLNVIPLPRIVDLFNRLGKVRYLSDSGLAIAYY